MRCTPADLRRASSRRSMYCTTRRSAASARSEASTPWTGGLVKDGGAYCVASRPATRSYLASERVHECVGVWARSAGRGTERKPWRPEEGKSIFAMGRRRLRPPALLPP